VTEENRLDNIRSEWQAAGEADTHLEAWFTTVEALLRRRGWWA
jgi:hypothetical protein